MRKISFLGLMLVSFQSMVLAQSDFGVSVGGGTWWSKCNNPVVQGKQIASVEFSPNINLGAYYKQYLQSGFTIEARLNYRLLLSNYSYKSSYPSSLTYNPDEKYYYLLWDDLNEPQEVLTVNGEKIYTSRGIGEETSTINYHTIEVPLQIGYTFGKFNPYIGMRYSLKMYNRSKSEVVADDGSYVTEWGNYETTGLNNFKNCFGVTGGINYRISDKLNVGINYYHAFTKDYNYTGYLIDYGTSEIVSKDNYFWKSRSLEVSLSYSFKRKSKDE